MSKRINLQLTEGQINVITNALYEYAEICLGECDVPDEVVDGYMTCKTDKTVPGYKVAKAIEKVSQSIYNQVQKARSKK